MEPKQLRKLSPSIKIVPLANGAMPEAILKTVFPLFGIKYSKKNLPEPNDIENCLRLVPIKLEIRDMLKERLDDFISSVDFLDVNVCNTPTTLMFPTAIDSDGSKEDNEKIGQIWRETIDGIFSNMNRMAEVSDEAAQAMGNHLLAQFVTIDLDITLTAWDLRMYLEKEFDNADYDLEIESFSISPFAQMLLQEAQRVWPWLVEDIDNDDDLELIDK